MISTRWRPDTRRLLIAGLLLSVLLHLFGGLLWSFLQRTPIVRKMFSGDPAIKREQKVATAETIVIERATSPKAQPKPAPPPRAHFAELKPVAQAPKPRPVVRPPAELAHIDARAPNAQPVEHGGGRPENVPQPHAQTAERPSPQHDRSRLTSDQIAKLESQFSQTIASTREDVSSIVQKAAEPIHAIANYNGLHPGDGYIRPLSRQRIDRTHVQYYVHYTYLYPDGHLEQDDVPWPCIFTDATDPFRDNREKRMPMPPPPPGYRPDRDLTPQEQSTYNAAQAAYAK
jgi:hypothetical protein